VRPSTGTVVADADVAQPVTDADQAVEQWTEAEIARRHRLVAEQAVKFGPPTPSRAQLRTWKLQLRGVEDRLTVVVEDVHITYRVYEDRKRPRARDRFAGKGSREYREIHAVRGVSFEARAGESIGIIGRNGSGKSTLLMGMAGLLPVDGGRILAHSQPSLLGVGAVLQPRLSGRRNIVIGTLALGMSKQEAEAAVDEITEFAGLEDSIDLPMRTYSSGMRARLQFAIATSVKPEILMIDEALAVGDEVFKRRSDERIRELQDAAGTIFIVSHGLEGIVDTCTRVIWLEKGQLVADGDPRTVVDRYRTDMASEIRRDKKRRGRRRGNRGGGRGEGRNPKGGGRRSEPLGTGDDTGQNRAQRGDRQNAGGDSRDGDGATGHAADGTAAGGNADRRA
jgi:teichoic acid transport system ATP-binding protein